jgi:hypothetical protein
MKNVHFSLGGKKKMLERGTAITQVTNAADNNSIGYGR